MSEPEFNPTKYPQDLERRLREAARRALGWDNELNREAERMRLLGQLGKHANVPEGPPMDTSGLPGLHASALNLLDEFSRQADGMDRLLSGSAVNSTSYVATFTTNFQTVYWPVTPPEQDLLDQLSETMQQDLTDARIVGQLQRIDPTSVPTYEQAYVQLYSSGPDTLRGALQQVRQLWDHILFDVLSPTAAVAVEFGVGKDGKPERTARLNYILKHKVSLPVVRESLRLTMKSDVDAYDELNYLHKRGIVGEAAARAKVREALAVFVRWLNAVS